MEEIIVRDLKNSDRSFVLDSWVKSYYGHSSFTKDIPHKVFLANHFALAQKILLNCEAKIAASKEDEDVIVGYIVFEHDRNCLHYIYVKDGFRGLGIGTKLIRSYGPPELNGSVSHLTFKANKIRLEMGWVYNPYLRTRYEEKR